MHNTAIMSLTPFISRRAVRSSALPAAIEPLTEATQPKPAVSIRASAFILLALLDLTCVLWICPLAQQLAEWSGVSHLNAAYIGLGAMLAAVPVIFAATVLIRRKLQLRITNH